MELEMAVGSVIKICSALLTRTPLPPPRITTPILFLLVFILFIIT